MCEQTQTLLPPAKREVFEQIMTAAKTALDVPAFVQEWNVGTALTQAEAIDYALSDECA
jgi:hypothetical protein